MIWGYHRDSTIGSCPKLEVEPHLMTTGNKEKVFSNMRCKHTHTHRHTNKPNKLMFANNDPCLLYFQCWVTMLSLASFRGQYTRSLRWNLLPKAVPVDDKPAISHRSSRVSPMNSGGFYTFPIILPWPKELQKYNGSSSIFAWRAGGGIMHHPRGFFSAGREGSWAVIVVIGVIIGLD